MQAPFGAGRTVEIADECVVDRSIFGCRIDLLDLWLHEVLTVVPLAVVVTVVVVDFL
jgi:hypothetical protein